MDKLAGKTELRILLLEDEPTDAELVEDALREAGLKFASRRVDTREAFVRALEEFRPDIVLADYKLPTFDGGSAVKIIRQQYPSIPVVMVTGIIGDEKAIELLRLGARDYVLKDRLARLGPAVLRALSEEQGIRDRKAAEKALRQSEADVRALIEHSPIAMIVDADVEVDEKIVLMNRHFTELFGYTIEDIPDVSHWWPLAYPDEKYREELRTEWTKRVEKAIRNHGDIEPMEATVTCKDGSTRYVKASLSSVGGKNIIALVDLTERKLAEDALKEASERNRAIMETANDAIIGMRPDGLIQLWNNKAEELFGYTAEEAIGHELHRLIVPERYRAKALEGLRQFAQTGTGYVVGKTLELTAWHKNHVEFPIELSISPMNIRGEWHATGIIRDITERKRIDDTLRLHSEMLRNLSEGIILTRASDGTIVFANPQFERMFGYESGELIGKYVSIVNAPDKKSPEAVADAIMGELAQTGKWNGEIRNIKKNGIAFWCNASVSTFDHPQFGKVWVSVHEDITERKQAEIRTQKLSRLYATLSQTNQIIVRSANREELFGSICESVVTYGQFVLAWIGLVEEETRMVRPVCHFGAETGYLANIAISTDDVPSGRGPTGTAIRENRVIYVNDYASDERTRPWREAALKRGFHGAAGLPLRLGNKVIGALTIYANEPGFFDTDQLDLLEEMATDIGFALDNLDHEAKRSAIELQLKERELQYRTLADSGQALIWASGTDKLCDYFNKVWLEFTGRTLEQLLGNGWADDVHPDDFAQCLATYVSAFDRREPFSMLYRLRRHDGEYRWLQDDGCPRYNAAGEFIGYIGYCLDVTEHKKAEAGLAESEERYRLVQENSMDAILLTGPDGSIFSANKAACEMFQRTEEEICKLGRNRLVDTSDPRLPVLLEERAHTGKASGKLTMLRKDGSHFPVEISSSTFTDSHGNKRSSMIIRDITERNRAENKLRESEERYRSLFENMLEGYAYCRMLFEHGEPLDFIYLGVNDAFGKITGLKDVAGKKVSEVIPGIRASNPELLEIYGRVALTGHPEKFETYVGELKIWFSVTAYSTRKEHFITVFDDITDRKKAEARLSESERHFRTIMESANDAVITISGTGDIVDWNLAAERLFGHSKAEMAGLPITALMPERFRNLHSAGLARVASGGTPHVIGKAVELAGLRRDGSEFPLELSLAQWHSGQSRFFTAVIRDITERKILEGQLTAQYQHLKDAHEQLLESSRQLKATQSQLLQSAKMASVGLLAAGVAHEINNPIGYVNSNLGTLEKYLADIFVVMDKYEAAEMLLEMLVNAHDPLLEELRQFKKKIDLGYIREDIKALVSESHHGLERVKRIILDLKNFSHADSDDQWMWADIHQVLDTTLNVVWSELKYKCEVVREFGTLPKIYCLPSQLDQVFMNLLVNAAQAIEVRGKITLRTGQEGGMVWVDVSDTGKGISPEDIPNLFDPFFTTKPVGKGTGLGLSVSYNIVEKHHGRIEVHSEVGKGSTFRVWLPVQQPGIMVAS